MLLVEVRSMLLSDGYFGPADAPLRKRISNSYLAFRKWARDEGISTSQPPFTEGLATGKRTWNDLFGCTVLFRDLSLLQNCRIAS